MNTKNLGKRFCVHKENWFICQPKPETDKQSKGSLLAKENLLLFNWETNKQKQTKVLSFWRMSPRQAGPKSEGRMGPWEAGPSVLHGWCTQWGPSAFHGSYTSLRTHSVTWLQHFTEDPQPYRGILKVISVVGKSSCEILIMETWTRAMHMTDSQMTTAPGF